MKFIIGNACLILLLQLLGGCAHLYMSDSQIMESINIDIMKNRYVDASNTINCLPSSYAKKWAFIKKREEIKLKLSEYESKIMSQAKNMESENKWKQASLVYSEANGNVPSNSPVADAYKKFKIRQNQQLKKLQLEVHGERARYLLSSISLQRNIENSISMKAVDGKTVDEYTDEAKELSYTLRQTGIESINNKDYITAIRAIHLAKLLNPRDREILKTMKRLNQKAEVIEQYVDTLKKQAASHYGTESYEVALRLWEGVLIYTPNDKEVIARIERVKRVLDSLQQIERTQP